MFLNSNAYAIGNDSPINWQGAGSRVIQTNPFEVIDEDITASVNTPTFVWTSLEEVDEFGDPVIDGGWVDAEAWTNDDGSIHGSIVAENYDDPWRAGSYIRDELYFETFNGQSATIEFSLDVDASAIFYNQDTTSMGSFIYSWAMPVGDLNSPTWEPLSFGDFFNHTGDQVPGGVVIEGNVHLDFSQSVNLSTNDFNPGNLVDSGTYLPFSLGIWGDVMNASINWGNTVTLSDVIVRDSNGDVLSPDQYTITSTNDGNYFADFNNEMPATVVPEPISSTLFIVGGGILGFRRFWKGRRTA